MVKGHLLPSVPSPDVTPKLQFQFSFVIHLCSFLFSQSAIQHKLIKYSKSKVYRDSIICCYPNHILRKLFLIFRGHDGKLGNL